MGKYEPLPQFLREQSAERVRMKFREIEAVLGFKLPQSAYQHREWWSNHDTGHSHARSWRGAGWRTEAVDLQSREVTFARTSPVVERAGGRKLDPYGCMAGTVSILAATDLTAPVGEEWNPQEGLLENG